MFRPKANAFRHLLWFECFLKADLFIISNQVSKFNLNVNDPSAGSPTETLLRLLLPLVKKI
jgi:hypothetical protein